jgi:hypothetical protein
MEMKPAGLGRDRGVHFRYCFYTDGLLHHKGKQKEKKKPKTKKHNKKILKIKKSKTKNLKT